MPNYATQADVEAYIEGYVTSSATALARLIDRAELDIDSILGPWSVESNGRKMGRTRPTSPAVLLNPKALATDQIDSLMRATCAQVEYRTTMGEDVFARAQPKRASGPDFSLEWEAGSGPPRIAPKVGAELTGSGLVVRSARARP